MKIYVYGSKMVPVIRECSELIKEMDGVEETPYLEGSDLAVAPLLQQFLTKEEIETPRLGTLIFHPSLLPRHRGRDAIKWAFKLGEVYTGATWFWADDGLDTGNICETEVLNIKFHETPREFYERAVVPSAVRLLQYALNDLRAGIKRERPQVEENATYERPIKKEART